MRVRVRTLVDKTKTFYQKAKLRVGGEFEEYVGSPFRITYRVVKRDKRLLFKPSKLWKIKR